MVFNNSILLGAAGQSTGQAPFDPTLIGNSIWLDGSADFLNRQNGSDFSNRKEVTLSFWVQRNKLASQQAIFAGLEGGQGFIIQFMSGDTFQLHLNGSANLTTNAVFRDIGWYHILVSIDTSQALSTDRSKVYINGEQITSFSSAAYPSQDSNIPGISGQMTSSENMRIGNYNNSVSNFYFWKGYIAQACMIESKSIQQGDFAVSDFLDTSTFGTNGSQVVPKKDSDIAALASAAGGNSFCLDFGDSSDLGNDISSNNNDFTPTSMDSSNQTVHTPSLQFPVLNVLNGDPSLVAALGYGNRLADGVSPWDSVFATKSMGKSGKYYYEVRMALDTGSNGFIAGIHEESTTSKNWSNYIGNTTSTYGLGYALYTSAPNFYTNGSPTALTGYSSDIATGDIIMMAVDLDNNKLYWGRNGTFFNSGDPANGTGESTTIQADTEYVFGVSPGTEHFFVNFGQDSTFGGETTAGGNTDANGVGDFKYTVPTGFQCLASSSLTAPDFQGIDYFDTTLYEGNGQNQRVGDFVPFTDTYTVDKSAMFDDGDRRYLARTYSASDTARSSNSQATISYWIKFCSNGANQWIFSNSNSGQTERFLNYINDQSGQQSIYMTLDGAGANRDFEIPISKLSEQEWTNIVYNIDVDNSTAADKIKCWVNGVQQTSTDTSYQSASNADYFLFDNEEHFIGNLAPASAGYTGFSLNSYLAEMHVLDGQLKAPTDFGQVDTSTNRWVPKDYKTNVGAYGNRGFYMAFDNATGTGNGVGTDSSGNGFNFTESFVSGGSAWAATDTVTDTPSQNFATLSSKRKSAGTLSEGNLSYDSGAASSTTLNCLATMPIPSSGKWAVKIINTTTGTNFGSVGVGYMGTTDTPVSTDVNSTTGTHGVYFSAGTTKINGVSGPTLSTWKRPADGANPFVELFFDRDANTLKSKVNGGSLETITPTLTEKQITFALIAFAGSTGSQYEVDFGQKGYTPSESGFSTLNQDNLDDTASKITAWAWIKNQDADDNHMLFDRVRGIGEDIHSNSTNAEATNANTVQRFLQRGVQIGNDTEVNTANESYTLWQWLLGDSATTGSTNSNGSLNTSVIAADAGHFSVVSWTMSDPAGAKTLGHGLPGPPELIIIKNRTDAGTNWPVYAEVAGNTKYQYLSTTAAAATFNMWQNTSPTSTVFSVSSNNEASGSANDEMIAYCFRSVPGVCKVGSFTGNFDHNGPYIHLGFKPAWYMTKDVSTTSSWYIYDSGNYPFNSTSVFHTLANTNGAGGAGAFNEQDFLSDGVKNRGQNNDTNASGSTFLYLAMAEIGGNGTLPPVYSR